MKKITGIILTLLLSCATFVSAQVTIIGATEASVGAVNKSYTTLKLAFDAINANTSALAADVLSIEVSANTTETGQATLIAPLGISSLTLTPGATTYKFPQITLTGGTNTATGTFIVTIYNGKIQTIANSNGAWTVAPTVTIEGAGGTNSLNVTTPAIAFCTTSTTNLTFYITDGGAGYGPKTTVTPNSGGSGAAIGLALVSAATTPASGVLSPTAVAVSTSTYLDNAGSGYTSGATAPAANTTGGTFASGTAATASYAIGITKANYASVKIYPTAANVVISASNTSNQPFITLNGTSNVTIDGRVHTAGVPSGIADLTIQYNCTATSGTPAVPSTNNAATIYLNACANHNTISYCKLKSNAQNGNIRGTLAIGTFNIINGTGASSVGGSYNTISYNAFSALNPNGTSGAANGNGGLLTSACCNDDFPNTYNTIDNNTFDNYFIAGPVGNISAAIYVYGNPNPNKPNHSNYTITNNSFFNSADGATTANNSRMFIKVGNSSSNIYGGSGHTISGNYIGGKAANCLGGTLTKTGAFQDNLTCIHLNASNGAPSTIQNNVMKNMSFTNGGGAVSNTTKFIDVNGSGTVSVTGNTIGDTSIGSIVVDNSTITTASNMYGIFINATGAVTCQNNTIGSITLSNPTSTANIITNFAGIWKSATAGNCTISNNTIGNATVLNSINNNSGSTQWVYPIYSAGTGSIAVNNNTIASITSNTTTGSLYGIYQSGVSTFSANANLIHSLNVTSSSTAAKVVGIYCASGTNAITNNIVKLNGDNAATIYGLDEEEAATASTIQHNTVYISGAPTAVLALNSACIASNGSTNARNIQNNVFVNARTNNGATGIHYALYMPATTGTVAVNANDYQATGASGAMLGYSAGADVSALPIVTGQDANSLNADPGFANAGGTLAADYMTSATLTGVSSSVATDYSGAARSTIQMGAWNKSVGTDVDNLGENEGIIVTRKNNQLVIICKNELKIDASVSVYNVVGNKLVSTRLINATTVLDNSFQSGIYLVSVMNAGKTTTQKIVLN